jgi:hypothetical protein
MLPAAHRFKFATGTGSVHLFPAPVFAIQHR